MEGCCIDICQSEPAVVVVVTVTCATPALGAAQAKARVDAACLLVGARVANGSKDSDCPTKTLAVDAASNAGHLMCRFSVRRA